MYSIDDSVRGTVGYDSLARGLYNTDLVRLYAVRRPTHCCGAWSRGMRCRGCVNGGEK